MGLGDLIGKVITEYKADISDHKGKIKELSGEQKKAAQEQLKHVEAQNKALQDHIDTIGKVGIAIGAVAGAWGIAKASIDAYVQQSRLQTAAAGADLDGLRKATRGLVSDTELLKLAAAGMNGVFKLTGSQVEDVAESLGAFRKEGHSTQEVIDVLTETLQKGEVDGLKKFGIALDASGDSTDKLRGLMNALRDEMQRIGPDVELAGDQLERFAVRGGNALDRMKARAGWLFEKGAEIVEGAGTELGEGFAAFLTDDGRTLRPKGGGISEAKMARIRSVFAANVGDNGPVYLGNPGVFASSRERTAQIRAQQARQAQWDAAVAQVDREDASLREFRGNKIDISPEMLNEYIANAIRNPLLRSDNADYVAILAGLAARMERDRTTFAQKQFANLGGALEGLRQYDVDHPTAKPKGPAAKPDTDIYSYFDYAFDQGKGLAETFQGNLRGKLEEYDLGKGLADEHFRRDDFSSARESAAEARKERLTRLEQIFGPVSQFDAYAKGFQLLEGAVSSAFDAWITGSKGVVTAMKEAIAGFAKSLATEALLQALRHGAYALGSLAFGDVKGAAAHGVSAAKWGAVALAAGFAAKELGGSSGGAGASAGGYRAGGGAGTPSGPTERNVFIGDYYSTDSPRQRARDHRRLTDLANRYAPPTGSYAG